jgi:hypothetical protein
MSFRRNRRWASIAHLSRYATHLFQTHSLVQARHVVERRRRTQIHRIADAVVDCEDHLKVRRGRIEELVPFSNISTADVSTSGGIHRITIRLRNPAKLGKEIVFLPQASLWSNLPGVRRVAIGLAERANQAS